MKKCKKLKKGAKAALSICIIVAVLTTWGITYGAIHGTRRSQGTVVTDEVLAETTTNYKHVVIFGVDGAGGYFDTADTPNFDRIYKDGNVNYRAYAQMPTTSAHNWTSMLHGVRYQTHMVNNDVADSTRFTNEEYPSIFKLYAQVNPNANMLSVVNWAPINYGIIEEDIPGMTKINAGEFAPEDADDFGKDETVCKIILENLEVSTPDILYMQFDSVDGAGHDDGYGSAIFGETLTKVDGLIGQIYDKYVANGVAEDTLFITVSDHGHGIIFPGHGQNWQTQRYTTFAVAGGHGDIISGTAGHTVTQDVASVVAYAMGFAQPDSWESKVPNGIFNTLPNSMEGFWDMIKR